jgi:plasmid stabilization system protein ParE
MTYHVIIQPQAEADIEAAYLWKRDNVPQAAVRWFAEIVEAINSLDQFPARCPLAPENEHFTQEIRQLLHGPRHDVYRILFTVESDTVHVLHVRHGAQQYLPEE